MHSGATERDRYGVPDAPARSRDERALAPEVDLGHRVLKAGT
jgi:hypothetical protein